MDRNRYPFTIKLDSEGFALFEIEEKGVKRFGIFLNEQWGIGRVTINLLFSTYIFRPHPKKFLKIRSPFSQLHQFLMNTKNDRVNFGER